jgi:VanZ family protein
VREGRLYPEAGIGDQRLVSVQSKTLESSERGNKRDLLMRIRRTLAVLWTLVILVLCWTPADWLPVKETQGAVRHLPHKDKIVHAGMFFVFAVLWLEATREKPGRFPWVAAAGIALAILTELVQNIPFLRRDGEVADALADSAGVFVGLWLFPLVDRVRARRQPKRELETPHDQS